MSTSDNKWAARGADVKLQQAFGPINLDTLPAALAAALARLTEVAVEMQPDDVSLQLDLPAGTLHFRCYRKSRVQP